MSRDLRGDIAAIALCVGVATATVVTALSETGSLPLDNPKPVAEAPSSSESPSKKETPKAPVVTKPTPSSTPKPSFSLTVKPSPKPTPKEFAKEQVGTKQFSCLKKLWNNESEWNHKAVNSSSGAYGIPQALPGSKMASAGKDWKTNPFTQVKWGVDYIEDRYGSPCNALAFWYDEGYY
ncbi:hypothetical protein SEA_LILMARTIN_37 [Streptomyces phage LilMartin]|nr:hypothetical protein SEA_LILMARTIN_37 [Streptomyces phage LilMartin]QNO12461.1 hydrolase [Streptomyces phage MulchMansion]UVK61134.1 endolysin [Streptomyces phage Angela]